MVYLHLPTTPDYKSQFLSVEYYYQTCRLCDLSHVQCLQNKSRGKRCVTHTGHMSHTLSAHTVYIANVNCHICYHS